MCFLVLKEIKRNLLGKDAGSRESGDRVKEKKKKIQEGNKLT